MKKKILCSICLVLVLIAAELNAETFDIATFIPPQGWQRQTQQGVVVFTKIDNKNNSFCLIGVYASRQSSGNADKDFKQEWNDLVVKPLGVNNEPSVNQSVQEGWHVIVGAARAQGESGEYYVTLSVFSGYGRVTSVIINYNHDNYLKDIDTFFNNFDLAKGPVTTPATTIAPSSQNISKSTASFRGSGIVGVWMGSTSGAITYEGYNAAKRKVEWRVFFNDNQYFQGLPLKGLYNLDINSSKQEEARGGYHGGYWGTYTLSGSSGTTRVNNNGFTDSITLVNANQIKVRGFDFYRCADVNGLRLDGAWTYNSNPNDPYFDEPGCRQIIFFTKAGQFTDKGIFVSDCRYPNQNPVDAPGSGTYQVADYTLILNYSDGRLVQRSFTGVVKGNPAVDNSLIFVQGQLWYKRK
jgi:hypothetical protein